MRNIILSLSLAASLSGCVGLPSEPVGMRVGPQGLAQKASQVQLGMTVEEVHALMGPYSTRVNLGPQFVMYRWTSYPANNGRAEFVFSYGRHVAHDFNKVKTS